MNLQLVQIALSKYGVGSIPGSADNPEILKMAKDCGFTDYTHDDIAWCSMFLNWVAWKAGYSRSNSLAARSWLLIGQEVTAPEMGDIVIFWRGAPDGPYGHAGIFIGARNGVIFVLGGNEGGMVQIEAFGPTRLLGYRRLSLVTA